MTDRPTRAAWYPAAIGAYLALVQWHARAGSGARGLGDLAGSIAAAITVAIVATLLARRLSPSRDRRALIALVAVCWAALFRSYQIVAFRWGSALLAETPVALATWTMLAWIAVLAVMRRPSPLPAVTRALSIAGVVMLALATRTVLTAAPPPPPREPGTRADAPSVPPPRDAAIDSVRAASWRQDRSPERPDIYVLLLDKYTSGAWLRANYGLDHRPFEDSLRALGFAVPAQAQANYAHTQLSVTSLLEGRYLDASQGLSWEGLRHRIENAPLWGRLQTAGYRYAFFPTTFAATRRSPQADLVLDAPRGRRAPAGETWWINSPFSALMQWACESLGCAAGLPAPTPYPIESLGELRWKLRTLTTLPDSAGPIVAFMHLLTPHEPYLFAEDCEARSAWWPLSDVTPGLDDKIRAAYATQVRCLDALLLDAVTTLIRRSSVPPIIILQADHGNGRFAVDVMRGMTLELEALSEAQLGERLAIFAAYRFPGAQNEVPEDMSPVNVMRIVLRPVIGGDSALLPTHSYWSPYQSPFRLTEIPARRLRAPAAP